MAECWNWLGCVGNHGYGVISRSHSKTETVHRVAFSAVNGQIPDGMMVLHRCGNRRCVNPDHLYLGSFKENVADSIRHGTFAYWDKMPHHKLTDIQVIQIRSDERSQRKIAEEFGVSHQLVSDIKSGKRRKAG